MRILLGQNLPAFYEKAAQLFLESVAQAVRERGQAVVALSGGSSAKPFFSLLAGAYTRDRIPWSSLYIFWVDERCVPPNHPDSNYGAAKDLLLSKVPIAPSHVFRMAGEMEPASAAAKAYDQGLRAFFKLSKTIPTFDFIILGMGEDGHTASLFPKSEALLEKDHWAAAPYVDKFSAHRITLTLPVINNARRVLMMCPGASKSDSVKLIFQADPASTNTPAQMVKPITGELIWMLDQESASKLPPDIRYKAEHF